jgi:hypothetical protein
VPSKDQELESCFSDGQEMGALTIYFEFHCHLGMHATVRGFLNLCSYQVFLPVGVEKAAVPVFAEWFAVSDEIK